MSDQPNQPQKSKLSWSTLKGQLADVDRAGLMQLVGDLYAFNNDNKMFLQARFADAENVLDDYKKRISLALAPDVRRRNAKPSVATARKAISEYSKAAGNPLGILDLRVFWCETASAFALEYGYADTGYLEALLRQYRDACHALPDILEPLLTDFIERMQSVRDDAAEIGYGVPDEMSELISAMFVRLPDSAEQASVPMIGRFAALPTKVEALPSFSTPAAKVWAAIPPPSRKLLLSNVWCGKCGGTTTIINFRGSINSRDLLLEGSCACCGGKVARVIERG